MWPKVVDNLRRAANTQVGESGVTQWTAVSSNTAVATAVPGGTNATFTVTAVLAGTCKVTITDGTGNSVAVKVTVS